MVSFKEESLLEQQQNIKEHIEEAVIELVK